MQRQRMLWRERVQQVGLRGPLLVAATTIALAAQPRPPSTDGAGDWPMFRHDDRGTGHSPLVQITPANVARLTQAWTYRLQSAAPAPAPGGRGGAAGVNSEATP